MERIFKEETPKLVFSPDLDFAGSPKQVLLRVVTTQPIPDNEDLFLLKLPGESGQRKVAMSQNVGLVLLANMENKKAEGEWEITLNMEKIQSTPAYAFLLDGQKLSEKVWNNVEMVITVS